METRVVFRGESAPDAFVPFVREAIVFVERNRKLLESESEIERLMLKVDG